MSNTSKFPDEIWNGLTPDRPFTSVNRPPDQEDWEQLVVEIQATQREVKNLIDNPPAASGGGSFLLGGMSPNPGT